jgi:hypothetical protein
MEMKFELEKDKLLVLFIITDIVFVVLHFLYMNTDLLASNLYSLSLDRGYAEFFQYTKELWTALLLLILAIKKRRWLYLVFSSLFLYFLIDDSFEFHERFGELLADIFKFQPFLGLRPVDLGELLVYGLFGLLFLISISIFYLMSDQFTRKVALYLIGMVLLLAGFGVLIDMVEIMVAQRELARILVVVEEAGEMLVMSAITWFVYRLKFDHDVIPPTLKPLKGSMNQSEN